MVGFGPHVGEYESTIEEPHNSQVRGTGGKGFLLSCCGLHAKHGRRDETVGGQNGRQRDQQPQDAAHIHEKLKKNVVSAQARHTSEGASQKKWLISREWQ